MSAQVEQAEQAEWQENKAEDASVLADALSIEEVLAREGVYVGTTVGVSMWPLLRNRRDTVVVRPVTGRLAKYDVPLYRRGSAYVLHRIVEVLPEGYLICGDNCVARERVAEERIIGVLSEFYRGGRHVSLDAPAYRIYVRIWCALYPVRRVWKRARAAAGRALRRVLRHVRSGR